MENYNNPEQVENAHNAMKDRIFALLKERHISQRDFAARLGIEPQTVTDWKKGRSRSYLGMLGAIARSLQTSPIWLYFGTGEKHVSEAEWTEREAAELMHIKEMRNQFDIEGEELKKEIRDMIQEAAARFGLTTNEFFNHIESNRAPHDDSIRPLAEYLGISMGEEKTAPPEVESGEADLELWELLKRIPPDRMPEVERYLRFQADSEEKP